MLSKLYLFSHYIDYYTWLPIICQPYIAICFLLLDINGAGRGNRTLVCSLEGCRSTIELHPHYWWKGWDSNPRNRSRFKSFQDFRIRPLCHLSLIRCSASLGGNYSASSIWTSEQQLVLTTHHQTFHPLHDRDRYRIASAG